MFSRIGINMTIHRYKYMSLSLEPPVPDIFDPDKMEEPDDD
jgi:hypothetical protein